MSENEEIHENGAVVGRNLPNTANITVGQENISSHNQPGSQALNTAETCMNDGMDGVSPSNSTAGPSHRDDSHSIDVAGVFINGNTLRPSPDHCTCHGRLRQADNNHIYDSDQDESVEVQVTSACLYDLPSQNALKSIEVGNQAISLRSESHGKLLESHKDVFGPGEIDSGSSILNLDDCLMGMTLETLQDSDFELNEMIYCGRDCAPGKRTMLKWFKTWLTEDFSDFLSDVCWACEGFYGPNFKEPVCATCHAFLFPEDVNMLDRRFSTNDQSAYKFDSDDSGNEEPTEFAYGSNILSAAASAAAAASCLTPTDVARSSEKLAEKISALTQLEACDRPTSNAEEDFINQLPPEVMQKILQYLDDLSLCNMSQVCRRWSSLLDDFVQPSEWCKFVHDKWPLFVEPCNLQYQRVYRDLVRSSCCTHCLDTMGSLVARNARQADNPSGEPCCYSRMRRLENERKTMLLDAPEGIFAIPLDPVNMDQWQAVIEGPPDSPYFGGRFYLLMQIPQCYPLKAPVVRFLTKIFHPNVGRHGGIGMDALQHNWTPSLTIPKMLLSIQSLLTDPYTWTCMEPSVGRVFREDRTTYCNLAKLWTYRHAMTAATGTSARVLRGMQSDVLHMMS